MTFAQEVAMKTWLLVCGILLTTVAAQAQSLGHLKLIAHYPLDGNASDSTGLQGPIDLVNAPFQDGGVFLNGVYIGSGDNNASGAATPLMNGLSFEKLAVSLDFKVTEAYSVDRPLIVCGNSWRWMSVWLEPDSTLRFYVNDIPQVNTVAKVSPNAVHNVTMTYDSTQSMSRLYYDGALVDSVSAVLEHHDDANFASSHGGESDAFKGIWADLKVYTKDIAATVQSGGEMPEQFVLSQNYPNPFNPGTTIRFSLPKQTRVSVTVSNLRGQEIATVVDGVLPAGEHRVSWDAASQPAGIYFYKLSTAAGVVSVRKMLLVK